VIIIAITIESFFIASGQYSAFSFSNPVYEPGAPSSNPPGSAGPTYKVEDIVVMRGAYGTQSTSTPWSGIKSKNVIFYFNYLFFYFLFSFHINFEIFSIKIK
jgi:hypothetical protein